MPDLDHLLDVNGVRIPCGQHKRFMFKHNGECLPQEKSHAINLEILDPNEK